MPTICQSSGKEPVYTFQRPSHEGLELDTQLAVALLQYLQTLAAPRTSTWADALAAGLDGFAYRCGVDHQRRTSRASA
jgi:hypothetical protein